MKIRKDDKVQVISGNYKGKSGRVLQILKEKKIRIQNLLIVGYYILTIAKK